MAVALGGARHDPALNGAAARFVRFCECADLDEVDEEDEPHPRHGGDHVHEAQQYGNKSRAVHRIGDQPNREDERRDRETRQKSAPWRLEEAVHGALPFPTGLLGTMPKLSMTKPDLGSVP